MGVKENRGDPATPSSFRRKPESTILAPGFRGGDDKRTAQGTSVRGGAAQALIRKASSLSSSSGFLHTWKSHLPNCPQLFTAITQRLAASCLALVWLSSNPLTFRTKQGRVVLKSTSAVVPMGLYRFSTGKSGSSPSELSGMMASRNHSTIRARYFTSHASARGATHGDVLLSGWPPAHRQLALSPPVLSPPLVPLEFAPPNLFPQPRGSAAIPKIDLQFEQPNQTRPDSLLEAA